MSGSYVLPSDCIAASKDGGGICLKTQLSWFCILLFLDRSCLLLLMYINTTGKMNLKSIAAVESCITLCGIEERKQQSQLNLSQKLCICQQFIKPFALFGHHLALFLQFIFNLFFPTFYFPSLVI
jgi:hypothetical protein